jgi:hypothetical protein
MGAMHLLLPTDLPSGMPQELGRACVAGGPDTMPWPTDVRVDPGQLTVRREVDESGCLVVPWDIAGAGRLMGATGTLIERSPPYHFRLELARGKVNQLRAQAAEWQAGGMVLTPELFGQLRAASLAFSRAVCQSVADQDAPAQAALDLGYRTARNLVEQYVEQMFQARHQRQPRLDTTLGCRLGAAPPRADLADPLLRACNSVALSFAWDEVEPAEGDYQWAPFDALLDWAGAHHLPVTGGPLIDFSSARLPDWLWLWQRDLSSLAHLMCGYVETVVKRYSGAIRAWQITTASNCASILGLGEDELLWLTARLTEAARLVDPKLELLVGIAQPWGEYMAVDDRTHSPFIFADTLIRAGLNLAALDLEILMGVSPRGSYCRDVLETSRLIDLYSLLGVPLRVTLGYPSAEGLDPHADAELAVAGGYWPGGWNPQAQAEWAEACAGLTLCKPTVRGVQWVHWSDADPHQFPRCGLVDSQRHPKPALQRLQALREKHLH